MDIFTLCSIPFTCCSIYFIPANLNNPERYFISNFSLGHVERTRLDETGVDAGTVSVTVDLKDVPIEMVLRLVLRQHDLAYMLDHGVVIVTTPAEVKQSLEIRVYSVGDLVQPPSKPAAVEFHPDRPSYPGPAGGALGAALGASSHVAELMDLITSTVEPTSWDEVGGAATIRDYRGALVIAQTYQGHHKVEKLLEGLREAITKQAAPSWSGKTLTPPVEPAAVPPVPPPPGNPGPAIR